ncbi:Hint domain-containing protein [Marimonas arenosa]|uniref:Hint domain-containing protein n=1 Tax=Marimonas arenosa TaxID=1795305 RepID=A0AAE3WAL3_9RHOB|nr:Hint domain-containing protein [Marimonas arenosa]MDQ2088973.1 Hint domain-containing protein [Marimonas arenosa]
MAEDTFQFDVQDFMARNELSDFNPPRLSPEPDPSAPIEKEWTLSGFHGRARVVTNFGNLPIMGLRKGDRVKTKSGAFKKVEWTDELHLEEDFLKSFPNAQPVEIAQNALGAKSPEASFLLSPAQDIMLPHNSNLVGSGSVLARELLGRHGVRRAAHAFVSYFLFHCGDEDFVCVEGTWCRVSP